MHDVLFIVVCFELNCFGLFLVLSLDFPFLIRDNWLLAFMALWVTFVCTSFGCIFECWFAWWLLCTTFLWWLVLKQRAMLLLGLSIKLDSHHDLVHMIVRHGYLGFQSHCWLLGLWGIQCPFRNWRKLAQDFLRRTSSFLSEHVLFTDGKLVLIRLFLG